MLGYEARLYSYEDYLVHEQIRKNRDAVNAYVMKWDWREDESMNNIKFSVGMALLLLLTAVADSAGAECITCKGGSASTQQDVLNAEWASFMNGESTNTTEIVYSTGGLVNPKYNRANNAALESAARASTDETATEGRQRKPMQKRSVNPPQILGHRPIAVAGREERRICRRPWRLSRWSTIRIILDISPDASGIYPGRRQHTPYTEFLRQAEPWKSVSGDGRSWATPA